MEVALGHLEFNAESMRKLKVVGCSVFDSSRPLGLYIHRLLGQRKIGAGNGTGHACCVMSTCVLCPNVLKSARVWERRRRSAHGGGTHCSTLIPVALSVALTLHVNTPLAPSLERTS